MKPKSKRIEKVTQTEVSKENKGYQNNNVNHVGENACALPGTSTKCAKASGSGTSTSGKICSSIPGTGTVTATKLTRKNLGKFTKKENTGASGGGGNGGGASKKTKVLGEASSTAALKVDSRTNKDSNIPRKKIKVSPQRTEPPEPLITCFGETSIKYTTAVDSFDMCFAPTHTVTSTFSSTSLPNFFTQTPIMHDSACGTVGIPIKKLSHTAANTLDLEDSLDAVPCCSYSLPTTAEPPLGLRSNSFAGATVGAGVKEFKSKFSKATAGTKAKVAKVGGEAAKSKLKKKRTLRADSSLKRKKTRVKPVVF